MEPSPAPPPPPNPHGSGTGMRGALFGTLFYALPLILSVAVAIPNRVPEPVLVAHGRLLPEVDEPDEVDLEVTSPDPDPEGEDLEPAEAQPAAAAAPAVSAPGPGPAAATGEEGATGTQAVQEDVPKPLARPGPPQRGKAKLDCKVPHPNVREGGDGVTEVDRSLVEEYTANLQTFMTLGVSRPYDENGIKGWYISGFNCTSPVHKAGFRRGDVLLSVNGKNTRSWVGVFFLYQKLKRQEDFEVQLVRKGVPTTLRFRVVG